MLWSMKKLLKKFPWFLDKRTSSNFFKSETVFNEQFKQVYNDIFHVYEATHIEKSLWIYKEQSEEYNYTMHFYTCFPYLKTVNIYKFDEETDTDTLIHSETYNYKDNVNFFEYAYNDTSASIVSSDKYTLEVETWEEYTFIKGFPENDEATGDIYDHDGSLDVLGAWLDVPRWNYQNIPSEYSVDTSSYVDYYRLTEPAFNNSLTEDDYHYMTRLLEYEQKVHNEPLPALEVWKWFGLNATVVNREEQLCKMFSTELHGGTAWTPKEWEHKDLQCVDSVDTGAFLLVTLDNYTPFMGDVITFKFQVINMFAEDITADYVIVPYLNGMVYNNDTVLDSYVFAVDTDNLDTENDIVFRFKAFTSKEEALEEIESENREFVETGVYSSEFEITVYGCDSAQIIVDGANGSDAGDGTADSPYQTLEKAVSMVDSEKWLILLKSGDYKLTSEININNDCTIVNCSDAPVIEPVYIVCFNVLPEHSLTLYNIRMQKNCCSFFTDNSTWTNITSKEPVFVGINERVNCKIRSMLELVTDATGDEADDTYKVNLTLTDYDRYPTTLRETIGDDITVNDYYDNDAINRSYLSDAEVNIYFNDELLATNTTDTDGTSSYEYIPAVAGVFTWKIEFLETDTVCGTVAYSDSVKVYHMTELTIESDGTASYTTSYDDLTFIIDEDGVLTVTHPETVTFSLSDDSDLVMEENYDY